MCGRSAKRWECLVTFLNTLPVSPLWGKTSQRSRRDGDMPFWSQVLRHLTTLTTLTTHALSRRFSPFFWLLFKRTTWPWQSGGTLSLTTATTTAHTPHHSRTLSRIGYRWAESNRNSRRPHSDSYRRRLRSFTGRNKYTLFLPSQFVFTRISTSYMLLISNFPFLNNKK